MKPAGGCINVEVKSRNNSSVDVIVEDNGIGIPTDVINKLGKGRYSFGKSTGNGLGISHANEILTSIDGSLEIQSELNRWTRVKMEIPLVKSDTGFSSPEIPTK